MAHDAGNPRPAEESAPQNVREGVRQGIRDALALELDRTSGRTVGLLGLAGALGLGGAVGAVVLFSGHSLDEGGHGWHLALCAAAWSGLLVECFAIVLLRIRTHRIPLGQACALALLGLALAAVLGYVCPDPHYLGWWSSTALGSMATARGGVAASAAFLGLCSGLLIGATASFVLVLRGFQFRGAGLPALLLFLLLWPAVILQCTNAAGAVFLSWSSALLVGSYLGVAVGLRPGRSLFRQQT